MPMQRAARIPRAPIQSASFLRIFARKGAAERAPRPTPSTLKLDRRLAALVRTDPHDLFERHDENLAVANLPRLRRLRDRIDRLARNVVGHCNLHLHLW